MNFTFSITLTQIQTAKLQGWPGHSHTWHHRHKPGVTQTRLDVCTVHHRSYSRRKVPLKCCHRPVFISREPRSTDYFKVAGLLGWSWCSLTLLFLKSLPIFSPWRIVERTEHGDGLDILLLETHKESTLGFFTFCRFSFSRPTTGSEDSP